MADQPNVRRVAISGGNAGRAVNLNEPRLPGLASGEASCLPARLTETGIEMLATLGFIMAMSGAQAATTPPQSPIPAVSANFRDNEQRRFVVEGRRARREASRQVIIDERSTLADRLDRLISAGRCPEAQNLADLFGYADIRGRVEQVCALRNGPARQERFGG